MNNSSGGHGSAPVKTQVRFMLTDEALSRLRRVSENTGANLSSLVEKAIIATIAPCPTTTKADVSKETQNDPSNQ
jgi:hypothetical protein